MTVVVMKEGDTPEAAMRRHEAGEPVPQGEQRLHRHEAYEIYEREGRVGFVVDLAKLDPRVRKVFFYLSDEG